jgi:cell division protein FtsL
MDLKEVLTITIPSVLPTLMVLFGILSNKNDINHVRTEIASLRGEVSNVRNEMAAMRKDFHADIMMLVNISNDLDKRVSRLEDKE